MTKFFCSLVMMCLTHTAHTLDMLLSQGINMQFTAGTLWILKAQIRKLVVMLEYALDRASLEMQRDELPLPSELFTDVQQEMFADSAQYGALPKTYAREAQNELFTRVMAQYPGSHTIDDIPTLAFLRLCCLDLLELIEDALIPLYEQTCAQRKQLVPQDEGLPDDIMAMLDKILKGSPEGFGPGH